MKNPYFESIESLSAGHSLPLGEAIEKLAFNEQGPIPVITQDATIKAKETCASSPGKTTIGVESG